MLGMRRWIVLAAISIMGGAAVADDLETARPLMAEAIYDLAGYDRVTVDISGEESFRGDVTPFRTTLAAWFINTATIPTTRFEAMFRKGVSLTGRLAGDGQYLWQWDPSTRTYSSSRYQTDDPEPAGQYADHRQRLLQTIGKRVTGPGSFGSHILMDAFGANASNVSTMATRWRPWMPTATVTVRATPSGYAIECTTTTPTPATLTYLLETSASGTQVLTGAQYTTTTMIGGAPRTTDWTATIYRGNVPTDFDSTFSAPAGSRSTSVQNKQVGG